MSFLDRLLSNRAGAEEPPVRFATAAWRRTRLESGELAFVREPADRLVALSSDQPPTIPPLDTIDALRKAYRKEVTESGGAIVSVEVETLDQVLSVVTVFKFPQQPGGMTYLAAITLPFPDCCHILSIQCPELDDAGGREAGVLEASGAIHSPDFDPENAQWRKGWFRDPYDPNHQAQLLKNRAEDEEWDLMFPEHPLSRARRYVHELRASIQIADHLRNGPQFCG